MKMQFEFYPNSLRCAGRRMLSLFRRIFDDVPARIGIRHQAVSLLVSSTKSVVSVNFLTANRKQGDISRWWVQKSVYV
jgi:hypothetical protein